MGGCTQWHKTTYTVRGSPFPGRRYIEALGSTGMTVRSHNLPEVELNRTNSSPDMTNTYSAGNVYFNNQGRVSIRQENNDK